MMSTWMIDSTIGVWLTLVALGFMRQTMMLRFRVAEAR